jgi:hypothetical protein
MPAAPRRVAQVIEDALERTTLLLDRWVQLGTMAADDESLVSRHTGGRG